MKYRYDAFISYSQKDKADVNLLYEKLKKYPVLFKRRRKIFQDKQELVAGGLTEGIKDALKHSRYLVVCNSENAVQSKWVDVEILEFLKTHDKEHILCCQVGKKLPGRSPITKEVEKLEKRSGKDLFLPDFRGWEQAKKNNNKQQLKEYERESLALLAPILDLPDKEAVRKEHLKRIILTVTTIAVAIILLSFLSIQWTNERKNKLIAEAGELAEASRTAIQNGDARQGLKLALKALPQKLDKMFERSLTHEAIRALYYAMHHYRPVRYLDQIDNADSIEYSPDGKYIITTLNNRNETRLWSADTGDPKFTLQGRYPEYCPDNTCLITRLDDNRLQLWDTETGTPKFVFEGTRPKFDPQGAYIVTELPENAIQLWDLKSGQATIRFPGQNALLSPKGNYVITQQAEKEAQTWDVHSGKALFSFNSDFSLIGSDIQVNFDENYLLSPVSADAAIIWNMNTQENIGTIRGRKSTFHPKRNLILVEVSENSSVLLEIHEDEIKELKQIPGIDGRFSPDGTLVITTNSNYQQTYLRDVEYEDRVRTVEGHSLEFVANGKYFYTITTQNKSYLWETATGKQLLEMGGYLPVFRANNEFFYPTRSAIYVYSLNFQERETIVGEHYKHFRADGKFILNNTVLEGRYPEFSPDNTSVITIKGLDSVYDGTAMLWKTETGKRISEFSPVRNVKRAYYSPTGKYIVTEISSQNSSILWDAQSGEEKQTIPGEKLIFTSDESYILSQVDDNTSQLWRFDGISYQNLEAQVAGRRHDMSADGKFIATEIAEGQVQIWDFDGSKIGALKIIEGIKPKISINNTYIATELGKNDAIGENKVLLYDLKTGKRLKEFDIADARINDIDFSLDNQYIVLALSNNTAKVWEIESAKEIASLEGHNGVIYQAQFTSDGQYIITASHTYVDDLDYMQGEGEKFNWLMYKWRFFPSYQDLINYATILLEISKFVENEGE